MHGGVAGDEGEKAEARGHLMSHLPRAIGGLPFVPDHDYIIVGYIYIVNYIVVQSKMNMLSYVFLHTWSVFLVAT